MPHCKDTLTGIDGDYPVICQMAACDLLHIGSTALHALADSGRIPKPHYAYGRLLYDRKSIKALVPEFKKKHQEGGLQRIEEQKINLHLSPEDVSMRSGWWSQAKKVRDKISGL